MLTACFGDAVELAWRGVVTHAVGLVIGKPNRFGLWIDLDTDRVPNAARNDFALGSVKSIQTHDAADPELLVKFDLVGRLHVIGLTQSHVELIVVINPASAGAVVV